VEGGHESLPLDVVADLDAGGLQRHVGSGDHEAGGDGGDQRRIGAIQPKPILQSSPDVLVQLGEQDIAEKHLRNSHFQAFERASPAEGGAAAGRQTAIALIDSGLLEWGYCVQVSG
jgi:hypothetical protein